MFKPDAVAWKVVPIETTPLIGPSVTSAPGTGVKILSGVAELYSCAVIDAVVPTKVSASVVEKNALSPVMTPSRGRLKAKLERVPAGLVKLIELPRTVSPGADEPNPIKAGRDARPVASAVRDTGVPEE